MATCEYSNICGRDALEGHDGRCILHSEKADKDEDAFNEALEVHRENHGPDFRMMVFSQGDFDFAETTFKGAIFEGVIFRGKVCFEAVLFKNDVSFWSTKFLQEASFKRAIFEGESYFADSNFSQKSNFAGVHFQGEANFRDACFIGNTNFLSAIFADKAKFEDTTFRAAASFSSVTFEKKVWFRGATFKGYGGFRKATFENTTRFLAATFENTADFEDAAVTGAIHYKGVNFLDGANFRDATFREETYFQAVDFRKKVCFRNVTFHRNVLFEGVNEDDYSFSGTAKVDFTSVSFDPQDPPLFRYVDLSRFHFLRTDLKGIELTGVRWCKAVSNDERLTRYGLYDEIASMPEKHFPDQNSRKKPPENWCKTSWSGAPHFEVERLYRQLKKNYENRGDFPRAGDFHIGEKEARRRNSSTSWSMRLLLTVYRTLSKYGERAFPAVCWLVILLIGCATGYYFLLDTMPSDPHTPVTAMKAAILSLNATFFPFSPLELNGIIVQLINLIQRLFSPLLLGLLALAIRQRVKR